MELIADALLIAGAAGAAIYCRTLARRLEAFRDLDSGLGAAIAALSRQVDELRTGLEAAKSVSGDQAREVAQLTARAEMAAGRLELLLASLHENGRARPVAQRARGVEQQPEQLDSPAEDNELSDVERLAEARRRLAGRGSRGVAPSASSSWSDAL